MLVTAVYFFMPVNYITLCSEPLRCRSVLSRSVSKVFPLLKHILCTAGRKQIPEDCVEIVTPPSCLVHTHRFQAQGLLLLQKEGNVSGLPLQYSCNFHMAGMSSVLLGHWYQWSSAIQCRVTHSLFALTKKTVTEECLFKTDVYFIWYKIHICSKVTHCQSLSQCRSSSFKVQYVWPTTELFCF